MEFKYVELVRKPKLIQNNNNRTNESVEKQGKKSRYYMLRVDKQLRKEDEEYQFAKNIV